MKSFLLGGLILASAFINDSAQASVQGKSCTVVETMVLGNRVHARCLGSTGIFYFAYALTDNRAGLFTTLASQAMLSQKFLVLTYESTDTSGTSYGCAAVDCRKPLSFKIED